MTVQDIATKTRQFIYLDVDSAQYRIENEEVIAWTDEAQKTIVRHRPDLLLSKNPDKLTALTDVLEIDDMFEPDVVNYVLFRIYNKDDQDQEARARAINFRNLFFQSLYGMA